MHMHVIWYISIQHSNWCIYSIKITFVQQMNWWIMRGEKLPLSGSCWYISSRHTSLAKTWNYSICWILCWNQEKKVFEWMNTKSVNGKNEAASLPTVDSSPQLGDYKNTKYECTWPCWRFYTRASIYVTKTTKSQALQTVKCVWNLYRVCAHAQNTCRSWLYK